MPSQLFFIRRGKTVATISNLRGAGLRAELKDARHCLPGDGLFIYRNRRNERVTGSTRDRRTDRPAKERWHRDTYSGDACLTIRGLQTHSTWGYEKQPRLGGIAAGRAKCKKLHGSVTFQPVKPLSPFN